MIVLLLTVSFFSLIVSLVVMAAGVELYRSLRETQSRIGLDDTPRLLHDLTAAIKGHKPSTYGLPVHLDNTSGAILFLSPRCTVCHGIAEGLARQFPGDLTVVVTATDESAAEKWLSDVGLATQDILIDDDMNITNSLNVTSTPALLGIKDGGFVFASSAPSHLSLRRTLELGISAINEGV